MRGTVRDRGWGVAGREDLARRPAPLAQTHNGELAGGRAVEKMPHLLSGEGHHQAGSAPAGEPRKRRPPGAGPARPLTRSRALEALDTFGRTGVVTKILH